MSGSRVFCTVAFCTVVATARMMSAILPLVDGPDNPSEIDTPHRPAPELRPRRPATDGDKAGQGETDTMGRVTHLYPQTPRTTPTRSAQRVSYDQETVHAVLDEALGCHVGFVVQGRPVVLPHLHARLEDVLYLHGSTGARAMSTARGDGLQVCVTVTLLDGLVLARSAFHHSVNYRSVVMHGMAAVVSDPQEKDAALAALVEAVAPGRTGGTRPPSPSELAATTVLRLDLQEVSVKVRTGPPGDDPEDLALPYWAGVLPLVTRPGTPQPSDDLPEGVAIPEHVTAWKRPHIL